MASIHSVEISWEDLLGAFSSGQPDKIHYLDRITGEIFSIPATPESTEVRTQLENNSERFLEIPPFDYRTEQQILTEFNDGVADHELKRMLGATLAARVPYGKVEDILSFYPQEEERFTFIKDRYLSNRLKKWMDDNNLFTANSLKQDMQRL